MNIPKIAFGAFLLIALAGCATNANYVGRSAALSMDMNKEQVVAMMGAPRRVSARKTPTGLAERFSWWSPAQYGLAAVDNEMLATDRVFVSFLDGRVVEWGDKYDYSEFIDKSLELQAEGAKKAAAPAPKK